MSSAIACQGGVFGATQTPYAVVIATHYDVLGVPGDASFATIRSAYRQRARRLHPDHTGSDADGSDTMAAVNEAYRILGEPGRRALYDRSLVGAPPASPVSDRVDTSPEHRSADPLVAPRPSRLAPSGPARVPWKLMCVAAVIGSALVVITAAFNDPPSDELPDGIIRSGSCVQIESNGDAREIACTKTDADIVVELLLPTGASCPAQMAAHRDRLGLGTACIPFD